MTFMPLTLTFFIIHLLNWYSINFVFVVVVWKKVWSVVICVVPPLFCKSKGPNMTSLARIRHLYPRTFSSCSSKLDEIEKCFKNHMWLIFESYFLKQTFNWLIKYGHVLASLLRHILYSITFTFKCLYSEVKVEKCYNKRFRQSYCQMGTLEVNITIMLMLLSQIVLYVTRFAVFIFLLASSFLSW